MPFLWPYHKEGVRTGIISAIFRYTQPEKPQFTECK